MDILSGEEGTVLADEAIEGDLLGGGDPGLNFVIEAGAGSALT